jgi:hypothetical protein
MVRHGDRSNRPLVLLSFDGDRLDRESDIRRKHLLNRAPDGEIEPVLLAVVLARYIGLGERADQIQAGLGKV